jgi:hypothetical protein
VAMQKAERTVCWGKPRTVKVHMGERRGGGGCLTYLVGATTFVVYPRSCAITCAHMGWTIKEGGRDGETARQRLAQAAAALMNAEVGRRRLGGAFPAKRYG